MRSLSLLFFIISSTCFAGYVTPEKKGSDVQERTSFSPSISASVQELQENMVKAYERQRWDIVKGEAVKIIKFFPSTPFAKGAVYFMGMAHFHRGEYEQANKAFAHYLVDHSTPRYFDEAIRCKFAIAEKYRQSMRKRFFGGDGNKAVAIYDEVIAAMPHDELAAQSMYGKGDALANGGDFRGAVEAYKGLIRRFPKHPLAVDSYIEIGKVYFSQSQREYPDADLLDLAELNLRKFRQSFPREQKVAIAEKKLIEMQDYYAASLFDTARFYEKRGKWRAAKIYYAKILGSFPDSHVAEKSRDRLLVVDKELSRLDLEEAKGR